MRIYKYYSAKEYNFDALQQRYFYFNKTKYANDPFDCNPKLLEYIRERSPYLQKHGDIQLLKEYGICCFSKAYDNKHLWSLYAENYAGFCVEFDCDSFEYFFSHDISQIPLIDATYVDKLDQIFDKGISYNKYDFSEDNPDHRYKKIPVDVNQICNLNPSFKEWDDMMYLILSIKESKVWRIEDEARLVLTSYALRDKERLSKLYKYEDKGYKVRMPPNCITRIIIGHNMEECNKSKIYQICKSIGLDTLFQTVVEEPFQVKINPIYFDS